MRLHLKPGAETELTLPAELAGLPDGAAPRAWFAGSLASLTVPEVVQFVFTSLKSGVLVLAGPRAAGEARRRAIHFRDGQVVFASSSDAADRLGAVLWRTGTISEERLLRASRGVRPGRPLGQVLVDEGALTSGELYEAITRQVREILLAAFLEAEGEFAFLEGPVGEGTAVKLPERTRDLLLEGMKRADEAERLVAAVGGRGAALALAREPDRALDARERRLADALDGERPIEEVASATGLGLLGALRVAAPLVEEGLVRIAREGPPPAPPPPPPAEEEVFSITVAPPVPEAGGAAPAASPPGAARGGPLETYRRTLAHVHGTLAAAKVDAAGRLGSYFDRLSEKVRPLFEGVRFDAGGDVDVDRLLANVTATGSFRGAAARARTLEALEDLLAFALFEVKNCLPRREAEQVLREVGRMQKGKR